MTDAEFKETSKANGSAHKGDPHLPRRVHQVEAAQIGLRRHDITYISSTKHLARNVVRIQKAREDKGSTEDHA
eukprot:6178027-Pleurochrysis_carterae.AAC.1